MNTMRNRMTDTTKGFACAHGAAEHKLRQVVALAALLIPVGNAWATSPYDLPYGIQWNFIIGNSGADNPDYCGMSSDGTVWMTTMGAGSGVAPAFTWGNTNTIYSGANASGYGQISPLGGILQGNDFPGVPGISTYSQGYAPTVYFAGNNPTAHVHLNVNSVAKWTDASPADSIGRGMMSFTVSSLAGSPPVDYNGKPNVTLPIKNAAGLDPTKKFTYELLNTGFYNGAAHDSAVASDGTVYWCTGNQGSTATPNVDMFTVGEFSGPLNQSYKPAIGWIAANGLTFGGPAKHPSCGGRSFFGDIALNEASNRVYACGYGYTGSGGTMNFFDPDGPGPIAQIPLNSASTRNEKGFAMVYDTTTWAVLQTVIWESTYGGDIPADIATTPDGGFVIVGATYGSLGGKTNPAPGTTDGYLEKYNADGSLAWNYQTQTTVADTFGDATVDPVDGTVYVSGNSGADAFLMKFTAAGSLVWTTTIDNGGTSDSQRNHGNRDKHKIYYLSLYNPASGGTPWVNTTSYAPVGNNENLLQKLIPGDFDSNKFVNFADVQIAGTATKPGLTGVDTYDFNGDGNSTLADTTYMITNIMDRLVGDIVQDPIETDVDNADIGKAIGAAGVGTLYLDGDIDFDADVDNADITAVAGAFTGAKAPGKWSNAALPAGATLRYRASDGQVWIHAREAAGGIVTSFQVENTAGTFVSANYTSPSGGSFGGGLKDVTSKVLGDTDATLAGTSGLVSLGTVFPSGMDLTALQAYLKTAVYTGQAGSGQKSFTLAVGDLPPPPATVILVL